MTPDRKSTRLNSSHTEIYTLSLHDALPIWWHQPAGRPWDVPSQDRQQREHDAAAHASVGAVDDTRSEEHTSELQSHRDLHSFPTRRSSDLVASTRRPTMGCPQPRSAAARA